MDHTYNGHTKDIRRRRWDSFNALEAVTPCGQACYLRSLPLLQCWSSLIADSLAATWETCWFNWL